MSDSSVSRAAQRPVMFKPSSLQAAGFWSAGSCSMYDRPSCLGGKSDGPVPGALAAAHSQGQAVSQEVRGWPVTLTRGRLRVRADPSLCILRSQSGKHAAASDSDGEPASTQPPDKTWQTVLGWPQLGSYGAKAPKHATTALL